MRFLDCIRKICIASLSASRSISLPVSLGVGHYQVWEKFFSLNSFLFAVDGKRRMKNVIPFIHCSFRQRFNNEWKIYDNVEHWKAAWKCQRRKQTRCSELCFMTFSGQLISSLGFPFWHLLMVLTSIAQSKTISVHKSIFFLQLASDLIGSLGICVECNRSFCRYLDGFESFFGEYGCDINWDTTSCVHYFNFYF